MGHTIYYFAEGGRRRGPTIHVDTNQERIEKKREKMRTESASDIGPVKETDSPGTLNLR